MYKYDEVYRNTLDYFGGDDLAAKVWIDKYALKDLSGNIMELTPWDMHRRLAKEFARIESKYPNPMSEQEILDLLGEFKYIVPQGSPMESIGNDFKLMATSNCYVIDSPKDSYSGILTTEREMIELYKRRGGVGLSLDTLRPKNMPTSSVSEKSSGLTLFGERYSHTTQEVAQDGRRGALMLTCRIDHPDVEYFADAKLEKGKIEGANMSFLISDKFMESVQENSDYKVYWEGYAGRVEDSKNARRVWDKIIHNAWKSAEPGVIFWDTVKRESIPACYGKEWEEKSTNPCSELPLCQYDSCRLMAINLFSYVKYPFQSGSYIDFDLLGEHVARAQRLLDDLIDIENEKIDKIIYKLTHDKDIDDDKSIEINLWYKIKNKLLNGRRTGLGITAEGDMLAALGVEYGSEKSIESCESLHKFIALNSYKSSIILAQERGCFPIWDGGKEMNNPFLCRILENFKDTEYKYLYSKYGRRNIANLTIAPTGSVSILTQTTSGIEPCFKVYYKRRKKTNDKSKAIFIDESGNMFEEFMVFHHKFVEWFRINHWDKIDTQSKVDFVSPLHWLQGCHESILEWYIQESPYANSTSDKIDYLKKVELQGAVQKWVDHSISVTINMPGNVTEQMVSDVYMKAWEVGCKGMTVYREGSRSGILISNDKSVKTIPDERPKEVKCDINHLNINGCKWIVLVGLLDERPYEIFCLKGYTLDPKYKSGILIKIKSRVYDLKVDNDGVIKNITGEFENSLEGSLTRQISLNLKHSPIEDVYIQLQKEGGINDFNKVVSRVLKKYLKDKKLSQKCPECETNLVMESGCIICKNCGYSKCG